MTALREESGQNETEPQRRVYIPMDDGRIGRYASTFGACCNTLDVETGGSRYDACLVPESCGLPRAWLPLLASQNTKTYFIYSYSSPHNLPQGATPLSTIANSPMQRQHVLDNVTLERDPCLCRSAGGLTGGAANRERSTADDDSLGFNLRISAS